MVLAWLSACAGLALPLSPGNATRPHSPLPWGDVNLLYTTDVHGWYSGNRRVDKNPASLGDLSSLKHWLQREAAERGVDVFLVDTGDYIDGSGLADVTTPSGLLVWPLLLEMGEYDILGTGNHELYLDATVDAMKTDLYAKCGGRCLTSNTVWADSGEPLGERYRVMHGANSGARVVGMSFMYEMGDVAAPKTRVVEVADAVKEAWFEQAMGEHASHVT